MAITWLQAISDPAKAKSVLLDEAEIAIEISKLPPRNSDATAWTAVGGAYTNLFSIVLDGTLTKSIVIDNIPRRVFKFVVGEQWGRKIYTQAASKTACNATSKQWYYNEAEKKLYVNPEGSVNLNLRICFAWVKLYFANYPMFLNQQWYEPRLKTTSSAFQQHVSVGDKFFTAQPLSGGQVEFNNADGYFDKLCSDYEWRGGRHKLFHGIDTSGEVMAYANYQQIRYAMVGKITRDDMTFGCEFINFTKRLDVPAHKQELDTTTDTANQPNQLARSNMDGNIEGDHSAIVIGNNDKTGTAEANFKKATPVKLIEKGTKQATGDGWTGRKFQISGLHRDFTTGSDHGLENIMKVYLKRGSTYSIIAGSQYTASESKTVITFPTMVLYDTDEIRVMVKGTADVAGKYTGGAGTAAIQNAWDAIQFMLMVFAGFTVDEINIPSLTSSGTTKTIEGVAYAGTLVAPAWNDPVRVRIHNDNGTTVANVVDTLLRGIRAVLYEDLNGKVTLAFLDAKPKTTDIFLSDQDIKDFAEEWGIDNMMAQVIVEYDYHPATKVYRKVRNTETSTSGATANIVNNYGGALFGFTREGKSKRHHLAGADGEARVEHVTTYATNRAAAKALADQYFASWQRDAVYYKFQEIIGKSLPANPGDRFLIKRSRAIGGAINRKVIWNRNLGKNFGASSGSIEEAQEAK